MDALETAAAVRRGDLSTSEACDEAITRIEARNPALNAVVVPLFEYGRRSAPTARGPFAGVPILLKDLGACLAGLPHYQGSQLLRRLDWRATEDAPMARRLLDSGFVPVGKTNTPEFGAGATTQPRSFGPTRNPWDLGHSTSGSSGGSAAAVAAGLVPIAHGNDFGGSIRMPAAWCGVIGLKPSRGRISTHPTPPGLHTEFVLTRSVRDAAAVLDAVADTGADALSSRPPQGWLDAIAEPPPPSRIGLILTVDGVETDQAVQEPASEAAVALASAGHQIVDVDGAFLADPDWERMQLVLRARGSRQRVDALTALAGRPLAEEDVEPLTRALADLAPSFDDDDLARSQGWLQGYGERLTSVWRARRLDAVLTPTTGIGPRPLHEMEPPPDDPVRIYGTYRRVGCFAGCWNPTGNPAISIPWWTPGSDPLPLGVQLVTQVGEDSLLLRLAHQLAQLQPDRTEVREAPPARPDVPRDPDG